LTKAIGVSAAHHLEKMVAGQCIYSIIHRELERETIPAAIDAGIGITCFSPLGGGLLTGKYRGDEKPKKAPVRPFGPKSTVLASGTQKATRPPKSSPKSPKNQASPA
jgi:aryl-alcohol dehydrogenase-like predicted oxidoreductase